MSGPKHARPARRSGSPGGTKLILSGVLVTLAIVGAIFWFVRPIGGGASVSLNDVELRGQALYSTNCASCHGNGGQGQAHWKSARPDGTRPAPPHDVTGHTWHHPDAVLFGIVKEGGAYAAPPGYPATMPGYKASLTDQQIIEVLTYMKTMWGPKERQYQSTMSEMGPFPTDARR